MEQNQKPVVELTGKNGNIFNLTNVAARALKQNNQYQEAEEMKEKIFNSSSYDEALMVIMEYVEAE